MSKTVVDLFGYGLEIIAVSVRLGHELRVRTKNVAGQTANFLTYGVKYVDYQHVRCVLESFHQRQVGLLGGIQWLWLKLPGHSTPSTSLSRAHLKHRGKVQ